MIKTVELTGTELKVEGLDGKNTAIYNKSNGSVYASRSPDITPNADGVMEIPAGGYRGLDDTNGIIYLLGSGKVELTGTDHPVNFKLPSQSESGGGGGVEDVTKSYVDEQDSANLDAAKAYTDMEINAVKEGVSDNTDSISELQTNVTAAQAAISTNTGDINTLRADLTAAQTDISANTAAAVNNSKDIAALQTEVSAAKEDIDNNLLTVNESISDLQNGKADRSEIPTALPANGGNAATVNGHTVDANVPANAKFTDTTYENASKISDGLMSKEDKARVDGMSEEINTVASNKVAEIVANAPEDLDTLKEIADWINGHQESAAAMNTAIQENKSSIASLQTAKADKSELPTTLPANGGNADTVNDHTVNADVPADAKFTDTIVDISGKMDKENPIGTGAFSMNRKIGSIVGDHSFAEGFNTVATNDRAHAEGHTTQANGLQAHSEGYYTEANGHASHAEGNHTSTVNSNAHAEGNDTCAGGKSSHAEGYHTYTDPAHDGAHAEGGYCTAEGQASHAQGWATYAEQNFSFAAGHRTKTGHVYDTVLGLLNLPNSNSLLTIGFGSGGNTDLVDQDLTGKEYNDYAREGATLKNVFRVDTGGKVYGIGAFNTSGADYAEYIKPWFDDNVESEDRRGYFVTVKDGKLHKAEPDDYIVGITSGNPSVVGNGDEDWLGRWQRDEFNELVYQDVEVDDYGEREDENGNTVSVKIGSHIEKQTVQNPGYDPNQKYIERKDRPEWSYVGMIGVLPIRDDGTCAAGGFAKCGSGGIATKADEWECHKTFFVIERINDHIISVEMR